MEKLEYKGIGFVTGKWPLEQDKQTLVFIHGAGGSCVLWEGQVDALKDHANTVAIDLPGVNTEPVQP